MKIYNERAGKNSEEGERNERLGGALGTFTPTFVVSSLSFGRQSLRASKPWWISSFIEPTKKMLSQKSRASNLQYMVGNLASNF